MKIAIDLLTRLSACPKLDATVDADENYTVRIPSSLLAEIQAYLSGVDADGNKKFVLYWLDGQHEVISGPTIEAAFKNAGIGHGALSALDTYSEGAVPKYEWDTKLKDWIKKPLD